MSCLQELRRPLLYAFGGIWLAVAMISGCASRAYAHEATPHPTNVPAISKLVLLAPAMELGRAVSADPDCSLFNPPNPGTSAWGKHRLMWDQIDLFYGRKTPATEVHHIIMRDIFEDMGLPALETNANNCISFGRLNHVAFGHGADTSRSNPYLAQTYKMLLVEWATRNHYDLERCLLSYREKKGGPK